MKPSLLALAVVATVFLPAQASAVEDVPRVLVVGAPKDGPIVELKLALLAEGLGYEATEKLPATLPWSIEVVLLGREPRTPREQAHWELTLGQALAMGIGVAAPQTGTATGVPYPEAEVLGQVVEVSTSDAVTAAASRLMLYRPRLRHPMDGPSPGVNPALHRLAFPRAPTHLPGSAFAFLAVLTAALLGVLVVVRVQGRGTVAAALLLASVSAAGSAALLHSGMLPDDVRVDRLVFEERPSGISMLAPGPDTPFPKVPVSDVRRIELLRVERVSGSGPVEEAPVVAGDGWHEIRYDAGVDAVGRDGVLHLLEPGQWALFGRVLAAAPETWEEGTTRQETGTTTMIPCFGSLTAAGETVEGLSGEDIHRHRVTPPPPWPAIPRMLKLLERHDIPRVAKAARAAGALLRLDAGRYYIRFPKGGPALVVEPANR